MSEWHITPEYIIDNWTDEKFDLLVSKLVERKQVGSKPSPSSSMVSDESLFFRAKNLIKVVSQ